MVNTRRHIYPDDMPSENESSTLRTEPLHTGNQATYTASSATELESLRREVQTLREQLAAAQQAREISEDDEDEEQLLRDEIMAMEKAQRIADLRAKAQSLRAAARSSGTPPSSASNDSLAARHGTPKSVNIKPFSSGSTRISEFLQQLQTTFLLQPEVYNVESVKVVTAINHMEGPAAQWASQFLHGGQHPELHDYSLFIRMFRESFDDPNRASTAARKMEALRQTGSVIDYVTQLESLFLDMELTDESKVHALDRGLKPAVRQAVAQTWNPPKDYASRRIMVIQLDQQLYSHSLSSAPTPPRGYTASSQDHGTTGRGTASLASRPRAPLSDVERLRRREQGLCLYCGGPGHIAAQCRNKRPMAAATSASTPPDSILSDVDSVSPGSSASQGVPLLPGKGVAQRS